MGRQGSFPRRRERAGTWALQGRGAGAFRAFLPKPLPPNPPLVVDAVLQKQLESAGMALGRLDGIGRLLPGPDELLYSYIRKEAVLSSQIEGTQSSLADLLLHELHAAPGVPLEDVSQVSNYVAALNHGIDLLRRLPLSLRVLREVHGVLVHGARGGNRGPGDFRRVQNWIGGASPADALFVPPPPQEVLPALGQMEKFLHTHELPTLLRAGLAHAQFETIHPFLDGNGRVGRMLIPLLLVSEGALERPWLFMSLHFKRRRQRYYDLLQAIRTDGAWEDWLSFFLDGVTSVADDAVRRIRDLNAVFENDRARVSGARGGSIYQQAATKSNLDVFDHLRRHVAISIPGTAEACRTTKPTVARALRELEALGIVREATGRSRGRVFVYEAYLSILDRDE